MQKLTLALVGAVSLFAVPAFAQSNSSSNNSSSNSSSSHTMSPADMQKVQQKITQDLKSDGYSDVQVIPNSFLVHATNKRSEPVVMIINPDSVFAVTKLPGQANNSGNSNASPNGSTTNQSGLGNSTTTKQ